MPSATPTDRFFDLRGLRHHAAVWGDGPRTVVLLHGWLDVARLFDKLAERLRRPELRLVALDFRGHGDSEHAPPSGSYQHPEYVADLHALVEQLAPGGGQVALVGHSMGGIMAQFFAGAFPERVSHLCVIESLGPPEMEPGSVVPRLRSFVEDFVKLGKLSPLPYARLEDAAARVVKKHPRIHLDDAMHYVRHGMRQHGSGASAVWKWKFDMRLHARGPYAFFEDPLLRFFDAITAPVLLIEGSDGYRLDPVTFARRFSRLRRGEHLVVSGAAHHVHLDAPDAVAEAILRLLAG